MQQRQSQKLLDTKLGRLELPRYRRRNREKDDRATIYAFRFKRSPDWVIIGKGWVSNMSEVDFIDNYRPSNTAAREMYDKAQGRFSPEAQQMHEYHLAWGSATPVDKDHPKRVTK